MNKILTMLAVSTSIFLGNDSLKAQDNYTEQIEQTREKIINLVGQTHEGQISVEDLQGVKKDSILWNTTEKKNPGIEPDPGDSDEKGKEKQKENKKEKPESGTSFSRQSGVGYSINGGKLIWANTFSGNGKLFKGTRGETSVKGSMHLDNPLDTKGQGKLILGTQLYKGFTFDGDYTFTGKGNNVLRFGMGYGGKLGNGKYGVRLFPLNTNGSEIYAKVSFSTKVGKNGALSSFVSVDFDTKGYYSETEYTHKLPRLAEGIAAYLHLRLKGTADGSFNDKDSQNIMRGIKLTL